MDEKLTFYRQFSRDFLLIYRLIHRTDLFISNGADLEFTNNILFQISFMVNDAVYEFM